MRDSHLCIRAEGICFLGADPEKRAACIHQDIVESLVVPGLYCSQLKQMEVMTYREAEILPHLAR